MSPPGCSFISTVRKTEPSAVGFTQADMVTPVVRSSALASGTVTQSLTPSKLSALPKRPLVERVAPDSVPPRPWPEPSVTAVPDGSSKP